MGDTGWSHDNKEWQETLDLARGFGWTSIKTSNHNIIYAKCPDAICKVKAYSTGRGAESAARTARIKVRSCPHRDISDPLFRISTQLTEGERLLDYAAAIIRRDQLQIEVEALLDLANLAEEQIDEAEALFDTAYAQLERAEDDVDRARVDDDPESQADVLVSRAGSGLRRADIDLRDLPPRNDTVSGLKARLEGLKKRHEDLMRQITPL